MHNSFNKEYISLFFVFLRSVLCTWVNVLRRPIVALRIPRQVVWYSKFHLETCYYTSWDLVLILYALEHSYGSFFLFLSWFSSKLEFLWSLEFSYGLDFFFFFWNAKIICEKQSLFDLTLVVSLDNLFHGLHPIQSILLSISFDLETNQEYWQFELY